MVYFLNLSDARLRAMVATIFCEVRCSTVLSGEKGRLKFVDLVLGLLGIRDSCKNGR